MDEIRPWLFIGNIHDTANERSLAKNSITSILQLAVKVDYPGITCLSLPVEDFAPLDYSLLEEGVAFIREQKKLGNRILVACAMGINRSSSFCTVALKEEEGLSLFDAFKEVKNQHSQSMPHEPVWESLCNYYEEDIPYIEIMRLKPKWLW